MRAGQSGTLNRRGLLAVGLAALVLPAWRARAFASDDAGGQASTSEPPPCLIAIPKFVTDDLADQDVAQEIRQTIGGDLRSSGRFVPIDAASYIQTIVTIDVAPRFPDWRAISAQVLLTGQVVRQPDDLVATEALLWDVATERQIMRGRYLSTVADCERASHLISTEISKRVRGA